MSLHEFVLTPESTAFDLRIFQLKIPYEACLTFEPRALRTYVYAQPKIKLAGNELKLLTDSYGCFLKANKFGSPEEQIVFDVLSNLIYNGIMFIVISRSREFFVRPFFKDEWEFALKLSTEGLV